MNDRSGKGFIELLKKLCHQDIGKVPDDYKTVPNDVFDKMASYYGPNPHPGCVILKKTLEGQRTQFLTMAVSQVLWAFVR